MDIQEEPVTASFSLQLILSGNFYSLLLFLLALVIGLGLESSTTWFLWVCFVLFVFGEISRLALGSFGNLQQRPQQLILSLCLAFFPGAMLSIGLLGAFSSLHVASQIGLSLIAISSLLEIPFGLIALWRLQRARSIRFKLTFK